MVLITSCIIYSGVEAPATIPVLPSAGRGSAESSDASPIRKVFLQCDAQMPKSFAVFELSEPPMTITESQLSDRRSASLCLSSVALHIVSKKTGFVYSFSIFFLHFSHCDGFWVVCAATTGTFLCVLPAPRLSSRLSSASSSGTVYFSPSNQLIMPIHSG